MLHFYTGEGARWRVAGMEEETGTESVRNPVEMQDEQILMSAILTGRGIDAENSAGFLNPSLERLHNPFRLEGMELAAARIVRAISENQNLLVYGDYDVDGTTAVSILMNFFHDIGFPASFYIPDRADEGYGISDAAAARIASSQMDVMVTVDCGITAKRQVDAIQAGRAATGRPLDIIITDHHQSDPETLPDAYAVIDPHLPGSTYPFKALCGAGIAWKLVQAVCLKLDRPELPMRYIDLAALATIADIVDLTGENRIMAHFGIEKMNRDPHPGIAALNAVSGGKSGTVDATRIGFMMAPRINAAGRMGDATRAVSLLTVRNPEKALKLAERLDATNKERQEVQEKVFQESLKAVAARSSAEQEPVTVVWGEGWHHGVIGIVASKLVERLHKPAIVLAVSGGEAVGSGRSIEGFDLFEALLSQSAGLMRFGGHSQAGGLTLRADGLDEFRDGINRYAQTRITPEMRVPLLDLEAELGPGTISVSFAKRLSSLEPTGQGNRPPMFLIRNAAVIEVKTLSEGKHLRLKLDKDGLPVSCVGFGMGTRSEHLREGDRIDVAGWLELNEWQGRVTLQFRLADMRLAEVERRRNRFMLEAVRRFESLDCDGDWLYNGIVRSGLPLEAFFPSREDMAAVFRHFRKIPDKACTVGELFRLSRQLSGASGGSLGFFRMMAGLMVFDELGLFSLTLRSDGQYLLQKAEEAEKVDLDDSELLHFLQETAQRLQEN